MLYSRRSGTMGTTPPGLAVSRGSDLVTVFVGMLAVLLTASGVNAQTTLPEITTPTLRYSIVAPDRPNIITPTLRYGIGAPDRPNIVTPLLRYGVGAPDRPNIVTPLLRYGVGAPDRPNIITPFLRYGVRPGQQPATRDVEFRLVRVTPLDLNNAINPFDYRDVISTINEVTTPAQPEPAALSFTGVLAEFVFNASLNFVPSNDPQQWSVAQGPDNTTNTDAAFGFWAGGFVSGSFELQFRAGSGWTSPSLPQTVVLASENFGFETGTVSFDLTRTSDGRRFNVTAAVSAGSDGDISVSSASGFDCGTEAGSCP